MIDKIRCFEINSKIAFLSKRDQATFKTVSEEDDLDSKSTTTALLRLDYKGNLLDSDKAPIRILYNFHSHKLTIEFNPTKLMLGNNIIDGHYNYKSLKRKLNSILKPWLTGYNIDEWILTRFEDGINIRVLRNPNDYLYRLRDLPINSPKGRYKQNDFNYSFYYCNSTHEITFYNKNEENKSTNKYIRDLLGKNSLLRYEIKFKEKGIKTKQMFGKKLKLSDLYTQRYRDKMVNIRNQLFIDSIISQIPPKEKIYLSRKDIEDILIKSKMALTFQNKLLVESLSNVSDGSIYSKIDEIAKEERCDRTTKYRYRSLYRNILACRKRNLIDELYYLYKEQYSEYLSINNLSTKYKEITGDNQYQTTMSNNKQVIFSISKIKFNSLFTHFMGYIVLIYKYLIVLLHEFERRIKNRYAVFK